MLGLILLVFLTVVGIGVGIYFVDDFDILGTAASIISLTVGVLVGIALATTLVVSFFEHINQPGTIARYEQTRIALVYQLENDLYDNDNDYGKKELYDQILEYNKRIAEGKAMQRNLWWGWLYPNIYDDLEPIEYQKE